MFKVSMITPTYNEKENIPKLAAELFELISKHPDIDLELIIVDDNSPDGTGRVADELSSKYPIKVIHRAGKMGLGSAVMEGFKLSDREIVGVMDADLSHDPMIIPEMIYSLKDTDIAIGSRFNNESSVENWRLDRKLISVTGVWLAKKLTKTADPLSGYFILHKKVIDKVSLTSPGYKILLEILVKGTYSKTREIPFRFRTREHSVSKLNSKEYFLFLKQLFVFSIKKMFRR
ncbi:MAG: polyprenol monophosphomannose synthase [Chitinispirillaceae bacterium]|nr:polyprenol monophosphomannose synthase [Chitinispirillaceae bacterium]